MRWLGIGIFYYVVGYVLLGGILVQWTELLTWEHMTGMLLGLFVGHAMGASSRMPTN